MCTAARKCVLTNNDRDSLAAYCIYKRRTIAAHVQCATPESFETLGFTDYCLHEQKKNTKK